MVELRNSVPPAAAESGSREPGNRVANFRVIRAEGDESSV
jgi:hypothetical protein